MPIILDHQLREPITFHTATFPITYFCDELASLPNWTGPLHWHPDFEIVTAVSGVLDFQVGQQHIILEAGDSIFEYIFLNLDELPRAENTRIQLNTQIRIQKMLSYIWEHYAEAVMLEDIAGAAGISRSEAGRCFNTYMGCSPVDALIQYRLQMAHRLIRDTTLTLQEVSDSCGFNSVHYFSRRFRQAYGYAPGQYRVLGK